MKPSKKKNCEIKKGVSASTSNPKINTYFKAVARQFELNVEEKIGSDEASIRDTYIDALKKKLESFAGKTQDILATEDFGATGSSGETQCFAETETCDEEAFATDPKETAVEQCDPQCKGCKEWQLKFDELQKLSLRLTIRNAEMDLKFEDLLRAKTGSNQFVPVSDDATADAPQDDVFTERELIYLKCMAYDKEMDSTFIHHCIQYAYKDNASVLVNKTLKGTADKVVFAPNGDGKELIPGKDPLTPLKVEKIRNLFINRISKCQLDAVSYSERIKDAYFNRLIGSAVRNISNKKENKPL